MSINLSNQEAMKWLNLIVEKDKQITEYNAELEKNNSSLEHNKLKI